MAESASLPPILVFDAVSGQYRDPSDSAGTTARIDAPTRTVLVTGGTLHHCHSQHTITNSNPQPVVSWDDKYSVNSPAQGGKPLAQA